LLAAIDASITCATVFAFFTNGSVLSPSASSVSTFMANRSAVRLAVKVRCFLVAPWRRCTS
jgi:hypothetical protein